jgi:glutamate synthase domain-containing protein 1
VALYHPGQKGQWLARVAPAPHGVAVAAQIMKMRQALGKKVSKLKSQSEGHLIKLSFAAKLDAKELTKIIEGANPGSEVISLGRELEIVKEVGYPAELEKEHHLSKMSGSHAIGHTRLSTESKIDISHSQPFWTHGVADMATVHNGHITNYHKLRRVYEQRGVKFYTENDSELVGIYLADQMDQGLSFKQALEKSMKDLDGSFCYLAATEDELAYVKDPLALKPLVVGEGDGFAAIATEEVALRSVFPDLKVAAEPDAQSIRIWSRHGKH